MQTYFFINVATLEVISEKTLRNLFLFIGIRKKPTVNINNLLTFLSNKIFYFCMFFSNNNLTFSQKDLCVFLVHSCVQ